LDFRSGEFRKKKLPIKNGEISWFHKLDFPKEIQKAFHGACKSFVEAKKEILPFFNRKKSDLKRSLSMVGLK
jgi:hypothetical protein